VHWTSRLFRPRRSPARSSSWRRGRQPAQGCAPASRGVNSSSPTPGQRARRAEPDVEPAAEAGRLDISWRRKRDANDARASSPPAATFDSSRTTGSTLTRPRWGSACGRYRARRGPKLRRQRDHRSGAELLFTSSPASARGRRVGRLHNATDFPAFPDRVEACADAVTRSTASRNQAACSPARVRGTAFSAGHDRARRSRPRSHRQHRPQASRPGS
jgi:hypothetical protein